MKAAIPLLLAFFSFLALAEPPSRPFTSFDAAKHAARDAIYADRVSTSVAAAPTPRTRQSPAASSIPRIAERPHMLQV
jgi:hypothetical protein